MGVKSPYFIPWNVDREKVLCLRGDWEKEIVVVRRRQMVKSGLMLMGLSEVKIGKS